MLRFIRRLLLPILKLFFNPNTLNAILYTQSQFNIDMLKRDATRRIERAEWNALYYEVLHNMVLETTRMSIEVKNLRMRVESLSSRLDFSERRVRALEGVVQYRPEAMRPRDRREGLPEAAAGSATEGVVAEGLDAGDGTVNGPRTEGDGSARRRRRRRRGRRGQRDGFAAGGPENGTSGEPDADAGSDVDGDGDGDGEPDGMDAGDPDRDTPSSSDDQ